MDTWENPFEKLPKKRKAAAPAAPKQPKRAKVALEFCNNIKLLQLKEKKSLPSYVNESIRGMLGGSRFSLPRTWFDEAPIYILKQNKQLEKNVNKIIFSTTDELQILMLAVFLYSIPGFKRLYLTQELKHKFECFALGIAVLRQCIILNYVS